MNTSRQLQRPLKRSNIFWLFIILAAPLTALIIGYASGYKFDKETGSVIVTSVLSISVEPKDATIFINGKPETEQSPYMNNDIVPGEYTVQIKKVGYQSWQKQIRIEQDRSVIFSDVILFPDEQTLDIHTSTTEISVKKEGFKALPASVYEYYKQNGWDHPEKLVYVEGPVDLIVDPQQNVSYITSLHADAAPEDTERITARVLNAQWHDERMLLYNTGYELWTYDTHPDVEEFHQLLLRVSTPITAISWHPSGDYVLYADATGLYALELDPRDKRQAWKLSSVPNIDYISVSENGKHVEFRAESILYSGSLE